MRRTERLFALAEYLRGRRTGVTAEVLAAHRARAAEAGNLTARGWTRTIRLARTIADLEGAPFVRRVHIAEALIYRRVSPGVGSAVPA